VSRLALLLTVSVVTVTALAAAAFFMGIEWNHRAANTCNEEAQKPHGADARGYSIEWQWSEFAYVCSYDAPGVDPKRRMGFSEAFL
jgi:hypothetical protein